MLAGRLVVVGCRRERAGDQHAVAVADHRDPEPGHHQGPELLPRHVGEAGRRQPGRDRADHRDPVVFQVGQHAHDGGRGDGDQGRRPAWSHEPDDQQQAQRSGADRQCQQIGVVDDLGKGPDLSDQVVALDGRPGELAELPDDHRDGHPGQVTDQDRLGQQIRDEAEPDEKAKATRHSRPTITAEGGRQHGISGTGSPTASGATTAAVISAVVDSGPNDMCREEPSSTYSASEAARTAHRPATGGRPARTA